ncbi:endonuclease/exonuclease/phosphatase family protein [Pedobacter antarcticus]|uniref:endonuclease/exonuclease/phosphatase family protein n=1 Tax=Pedobacter antarcticus TaxID=34086 RepID=UPI0008840334|nr:endonuclease/exonuclease/phosphatase family protein [Pedobacter antarcticus]SDM14939.1 Metal-dependent hydrolase, endonuclease/exonuclease/phosphatase family [Pedobacter antarcticus]
MRNNFYKKTVLAAALLLSTNFALKAQNLTIGSFNIRFDNPADSGNLWKDRAPVVSDLIRFHDFDVLGVQEALKNQVADLSAALPEYERYGKGRDDGKDGGEHSAIYFKKERFKLIKSGDFWLSETPDKPGKGWDVTCCNRICSWVFLEDKQSKKKFYAFNVHFDHQAVIARQESSKLMLQKIKEIAGDMPAILTGDFNGSRDTEWYKALATSGLISDVYEHVSHPYANNSSANGFKTPKGNAVIDHIFSTRHFTAKKWGILTDTYFGKFPSDHFPILAEVVLK